MPERPTGRLRHTLLVVLAVALVAAGAVGGALSQRTDPKEPKQFSKVAGDTCHTVLLGLSPSVLDRVVPESHYVGGWQKVTRKKGEYSSWCGINADGKQALRVSVRQQYVATSLRGPVSKGKGKSKKVPGFEESWSTPDGAAATVPCTRGKDKDGNTELEVVVESFAHKGKDVREDMVRILKAALKTNRELACYAAPMEDGSAYD